MGRHVWRADCTVVYRYIIPGNDVDARFIGAGVYEIASKVDTADKAAAGVLDCNRCGGG